MWQLKEINIMWINPKKIKQKELIKVLNDEQAKSFLVQNQLRLGTQALTEAQLVEVLIAKGLTEEKALETAAEIANTTVFRVVGRTDGVITVTQRDDDPLLKDTADHGLLWPVTTLDRNNLPNF